jgi:hypothetical protein
MWIEVFKAGTWTDASGKTREWSIHDIDRIIDNYDAELNEAPLVLRHPEDDSPAYGWVEAIKRVGDTMLVKPIGSGQCPLPYKFCVSLAPD